MIRCSSCEYCGSEEAFTPSDGNPAPLVCPECGRTDCFETIMVRYHFSREHKPGEYVGFEVRICYNDDDECISSIEDEEHYMMHREDGTHFFWSVYGKNGDGTVDCLGDFATEAYALETVRKLGGHLTSSW